MRYNAVVISIEGDTNVDRIACHSWDVALHSLYCVCVCACVCVRETKKYRGSISREGLSCMCGECNATSHEWQAIRSTLVSPSMLMTTALYRICPLSEICYVWHDSFIGVTWLIRACDMMNMMVVECVLPSASAPLIYLQCVAVCSSVLQLVAACCSLLHCVAVYAAHTTAKCYSVLHCNSCTVLQKNYICVYIYRYL